jgi:hypothetical protein
MKYLICIIFVLCFCKHGIAQAWQVNLSGDYLSVTQWDRAINTYNFSRPFVNQKQPLIKFGIKASLNYFFIFIKKRQFWFTQYFEQIMIRLITNINAFY